MRIGSLFSGAGGLDMAVERVFGAETVWHVENNPAASKVLAHRWPNIPNHHDITQVDWNRVEPVDILCGGWPCQPFSQAGKRLGAEDERALWPHVAGAIRMVRPRWVVLENVSAVLTAGEFQRVADDLASSGYEFSWVCVRASDVGAPHRRERVFILAHTTEQLSTRIPPSHDSATLDTPRITLLPTPCAQQSGNTPENHLAKKPGRQVVTDLAILVENGLLETGGELLPTPNAQDGNGGGGGRYSSDGDQSTLPGEVRLLPAPRTSDTNTDDTRWRQQCRAIAASTELPPSQHNGYFVDEVDLLGTPSAADSAGGHLTRSGSRSDELLLPGQAKAMAGARWGPYAPAIHRWEGLTRSAPAPTEPNRNGNPRLNPQFSEWLMGWPTGWVTQVPGISRNYALAIIGNGVVPQQAAHALTYLLNVAQVPA